MITEQQAKILMNFCEEITKLTGEYCGFEVEHFRHTVDSASIEFSIFAKKIDRIRSKTIESLLAVLPDLKNLIVAQQKLEKARNENS